MADVGLVIYSLMAIKLINFSNKFVGRPVYTFSLRVVSQNLICLVRQIPRVENKKFHAFHISLT